MKRLAVIGSGIAGLGCVYFLHPHFDITLFDENAYAGGHTNTIDIQEPERIIPVDTGFMVFNKVTYPYLTQLFETLSIPIKPTDMSFSVRHDALNLEWNGAGLNKLFGQRKNLWNPRFWEMLRQMNRFCKEAIENLDNPRYETLTVAELITERNYGKDFLELFLVPMSSAIWSTPPHKMMRFPARTLIRFFYNHGFLGLDTHHQWYTVDQGARTYVRRLLGLCKPELRLNQPVKTIKRLENGTVDITTKTASGALDTSNFDHVIVATHADQALTLLEEPTSLQFECLSAFQYEANQAIVHSDTSVLPKTKRCWASWNYHIRPANAHSGSTNGEQLYDAATHYWMNNLQGLPSSTQYIVSINGIDRIHPDKILKTIAYHHPIFDNAAIEAQARLPQLNNEGHQSNIYFTGSYFRYGFHEDAFGASVALSECILNQYGLGELTWKR